jgi:hypothetical protein
MSILDKVAAAVMPLASEEDRAEARAKFQSLSGNAPWVGLVLDHHLQLEALFAEALRATDATSRANAHKDLGVFLTGHANAEESVLYAAMVKTGHQHGATTAYTQQATAKTEMFLLEGLDPASEDYTDKLTHVRDAVAQHMYEEEGTWFAELSQSEADQATLTKRYTEEFTRYVEGEPKPALFS